MYIAFSLWDQKKDIQRLSQSWEGSGGVGSVEIKSNLFSGTHCRLSPCTSRKHAIIFCQLSLCAIPNRAPKIFFFFFSLWAVHWIPLQTIGRAVLEKKKRIFVLRVIACVLWESPDHLKRDRSILFSPDRELQCKNESAPLLEFYRQLSLQSRESQSQQFGCS